MAKKIPLNWKSSWWSFPNQNRTAIKLGLSILFLGFVFRLFYCRSFTFSSHSGTPFVQHNPQVLPQGIGLESSDENETKCDLFNGSWVPNKEEPFYTNVSCTFIEAHQNCLKNGRPDTGYIYWRWKPRACDLPRIDPARFLDLMRGKSWAFIGDSISRNHVQSLLCILSSVEKAIEVYHDETFQSKRWHFPAHNFTLSVIWSPFFAKAAIFEDMNGVSTSEVELQLDVLDKNWTSQCNNIDYMIFSGGKWFVKSTIYYENDTLLGCHNCPKRNFTEIGFELPYRKVLRSLFNYITESKHKGTIFYRTSTPDHFEGGEWYNGGGCRRTMPVGEGEFEFNELNKILRRVELEEFEKASSKALKNKVKLGLFDVAPLSLLRPDGHPGPYRFFQPFGKENVVNDCLHWCLPGPIDSWNDVLMKMVMDD